MATPSGDPTPIVLPGVGRRLDLADLDGRPVAVVQRRDGHVEVHAAETTYEFDEHAGRSLAAFLGGRFGLPRSVSARLDDVLGGLDFELHPLAAGSFAAGRTIEELGVRRRTGITIVAVFRGPIPVVAPDPTIQLAAGDELLVAGRPGDFDAFVRYLTTGR